MNRWQLSKDWVLVWGFTFVLVGLILYTGYRSSVFYISSEKSQEVTQESLYTESECTAQNSGSSAVNEMSVNTSEHQANSTNQNHDFQKELNLVFGQINAISKPLELKDFPSPVDGKPIRNVGNYYSEKLGNYIFHTGVDYALSEGTVIRATCGGKVVFSGSDPILGQKVILDCGEGWLVTYGGLDSLRVQEGEVVDTQGALGQVGFFPGAEGERDQPQLHYEVWHGDALQRPSY